MKKKTLLLFVLPIMLFSCKDAIDELSNIGTFKSTISGDVTEQFDGEAGFVHTLTVDATPKGSSLIIALSKVSDKNTAIGLSLIEDATDGIAVGSYSISSSSSGTAFIPVFTKDNVVYSLPDLTKTNNITISSVENLRVKGSFEVNLIEPTTQKAVKIVGTFDSVGITENK